MATGAKTFQTHDNGGRAYQVEIRGDAIAAFELDGERRKARRPAISARSSMIFVGTSPLISMTEFSGGHGSGFDGNSVLYWDDAKGPLEYVHIGRELLRFRARAPVVEYVSPVGNSDVPYPYAVDGAGNTYLVIENVVLTRFGAWRAAGYDDPYSYFYAASAMTRTVGEHPPRDPPVSSGIVAWWLGGEPYQLKYNPDPEADYDRLARDLGPMSVLREGRDAQEPMSKAEYAGALRSFGVRLGFEPMGVEKIQ